MKSNILFASTAAVTNTIALNICAYFFSGENAEQFATNLAQLISPFLALALFKFYVKFDHPAELVRAESAIEAAIKACKEDLNDPDVTDEFKNKTRENLSQLRLKRQMLRLDFEQGKIYTASLPLSAEKSE